jgi:hypothetical protein
MPRRLLLALLLLTPSACSKELTCPRGQVACQGACVPLLSDAANCGACGHACGARSVCSAGACLCAPGSTACGAACVDLTSDPAHCGACDAACGAAAPFCALRGDLAPPAPACGAGCASLPVPLGACGHACVDLQRDPYHCGDCGASCAPGQACRQGACHSDLQVACGATSQIVPLDADLSPAGGARAVTAGLTTLAVGDGVIYAGSGYPSAAVDLVPLDARAVVPVTSVPLAGTDLEGIAIHHNVVFVSNASVDTLVILSPLGAKLDEIPLGDQQAGPNPRGLAFVGTRAFVALGGSDASSGQAVAVVDLSGLAACAATGDAAPACGGGGSCPSGRHCIDQVCRLPCGRYDRSIDLKAVPGAFDPPGAPFPSRAVAVGDRVYLSLGNLAYADLGGGFAGWFKPAGHGRLAVIDTAHDDAVSVIDLGAECGNPGGLAVDGATLWVACGSLSFGGEWPGRVVPVDLRTGTAPRPTPPLAVATGAIVPAGVVVCGGSGYVPDMASGQVLRFDSLTGVAGTPVAVCPDGPYGFAWVSDLACAP